MLTNNRYPTIDTVKKCVSLKNRVAAILILTFSFVSTVLCSPTNNYTTEAGKACTFKFSIDTLEYAFRRVVSLQNGTFAGNTSLHYSGDSLLGEYSFTSYTDTAYKSFGFKLLVLHKTKNQLVLLDIAPAIFTFINPKNEAKKLLPPQIIATPPIYKNTQWIVLCILILIILGLVAVLLFNTKKKVKAADIEANNEFQLLNKQLVDRLNKLGKNITVSDSFEEIKDKIGHPDNAVKQQLILIEELHQQHYKLANISLELKKRIMYAV